MSEKRRLAVWANAARRIGMTPEAYAARRAAGESWCPGGHWALPAAFGSNAYCRACYLARYGRKNRG